MLQQPITPSEHTRSPADRIDGIQILRTVAILAVLAQHLALSGHIFKDLFPNLSLPFYSGVELFFIISGFVVLTSLSKTNFLPGSFAVRRVFRLYPPIFFFFLVSFFQIYLIGAAGLGDWAVALFGAETWSQVWFQAVTIIAGVFINFVHKPIWANAGMWSLSVEFQFYFAVFVMIIILRIFRQLHRSLEKFLVIFCAFLYILCISFRIGGFHFQINNYVLTYLINCKFDFMMIGVILFGLDRYRIVQRPDQPRWLICCIAITAAFVILAFSRGPLDAERWRHDLEGYPMVLTGWCFAVALWFALSGDQHEQKPPGWIQKILIAMGDRSYTIYLLHFPCLALIWLWIVKFDITIAADPANRYFYATLQAVFLLVLCGVLTEVSYRYVEKPSIRIGQRITRRLRNRGPKE